MEKRLKKKKKQYGSGDNLVVCLASYEAMRDQMKYYSETTKTMKMKSWNGLLDTRFNPRRHQKKEKGDTRANLNKYTQEVKGEV